MPVLRVDAHFTVIEAGLKGYMKWRGQPRHSEGFVSLDTVVLTWYLSN